MLLSFLLAFLLMVLGRNGLAASVEDAAKAEGNVVLYGTMSAPVATLRIQNSGDQNSEYRRIKDTKFRIQN